MKYGLRKPSIKKSESARTTGKLKRSAKSAISPVYGKRCAGVLHDQKKSLYNKTYNKTTFSTSDLINDVYSCDSFPDVNADDFSDFVPTHSAKTYDIC